MPQEDGGHLQQAAQGAVLDSAEVGVAGLGGEVSFGRDLIVRRVRDNSILKYQNYKEKMAV